MQGRQLTLHTDPSQTNSILGDPGAVSRGRAKWRDESFQERAEEPLGTKSHRTISKRLREYWLLIEQKKSLVLFCPIGEQQLSNHFRVFLHGDCCPAIFIWIVHQNNASHLTSVVQTMTLFQTKIYNLWVPFFTSDPVVQRVDNIIQWINRYSVDKIYSNTFYLSAE